MWIQRNIYSNSYNKKSKYGNTYINEDNSKFYMVYEKNR